MALFGKRRYCYLIPLLSWKVNTTCDQISNGSISNNETSSEVVMDKVTTDNHISNIVASSPKTLNNRIGLFDDFPILRRTTIGVPNGFWTGGWGEIRDWVAILTNSQLYDNSGNPVGSSQLVVQIPINKITYVF